MMLLAMVTMLAQAPPTKALPATSTSKDMYDFWCTAARSQSVLCQHHSLVGQMGKTSDTEEKKKISEKIKTLLKAAAPPPSPSSGLPRPQSPFSKEYSQMKMAYCATNPAGGKTMCSTAASQFKTAGASSTKPSSATSSVTQSANEVWTWYCSKGKPSADKDKLCADNTKRQGVLDKLRTGSGLSAEERKKLLDQLKLTPPPAYATTQALYADFCKVSEHAEKLTCTRLKASQASTNMRKWYCETRAGSSDWCKRQAVLEKMQKIPIMSTPTSEADKAAYEERKKLAAEYSEFSKPPPGGGPSKAALIAKEITEAKKLYCAQDANKSLSYCKAPPPGGLPMPPRRLTPLGKPSSPFSKPPLSKPAPGRL